MTSVGMRGRGRAYAPSPAAIRTVEPVDGDDAIWKLKPYRNWKPCGKLPRIPRPSSDWLRPSSGRSIFHVFEISKVRKRRPTISHFGHILGACDSCS